MTSHQHFQVSLWIAAALFSLAGCGERTDQRQNRSSPTAKTAELPAAYTIKQATWDEEAFHDRTALRLKQISQWLVSKSTPANKPTAQRTAENPAKEDLAELLGPSFVTTPLRPATLEGQVVYHKLGIRVIRWGNSQAPTESKGTPTLEANQGSRGIEGLAAALEAVRAPWPDDADQPRVKLKQFDVQPDGQTVVTRAHFAAYARGKRQAVQQTGTWICRWHFRPKEVGPPTLQAIQLERLDEVSATLRNSRQLFVDVTQALIGELDCYQQQLKYGANYWITRRPRLKHRFHHGVAIGDLNGDGREDVYVCEPEGMPNLLFLKEPNGGLREAAAEFGLNWLDYSRSALILDLDNDGDQDLVLARWNKLSLLENQDGRFQQAAEFSGRGQLTSLCAADYNQDGLIDLYTCRYSSETLDGRPVDPIPHHDATNGGANTLLANRGQLRFEDVTQDVGLDHNNDRWSFAASWEDYDNDGDLDLYVANDYGRNNLYQLQQTSHGKIRFRDVAAEAMVEDQSFGMSVAWGDPNRDGRFDVHISNMFSSAGQRITFQRNFKRAIQDVDDQHIQAVRYGSLGNSLFQNRGDGQFDYVSAQAGMARGLWAWSSPFLDLNNDGWEDLVVANGFITGPSDTKDL